MFKEGTNENLAHKIINQSLKYPLRLVSFVGKPFYFLIVGLVYLLYITGYFIRVVFKNSIDYFLSILITACIDLPKQLIALSAKNVSDRIEFENFKTRVTEDHTQKASPLVQPNTITRISRNIQNAIKKVKRQTQMFGKWLSVKATKVIRLLLRIVAGGSKISKIRTRGFKVIVKKLGKQINNVTVSILLGIVGLIKNQKLQFLSLTFKLSKLIRKVKKPVFVAKIKIKSIPSKIVTSLLAWPKRFSLKIRSLKKVFLKSRKKKSVTPSKKIIHKPFLIRFRFAFLLLLFILISATSSYYIFWRVILKDLPSANDLTSRKSAVSTKIYDRNGILLYTIYKDINRTPISLSDIPAQVRLSTLAIEDAEFYSHPGFSIRGIIRALYKNIKNGQITGGSTITQQLVKNTLLSPEKTLIRKIKEVVLAIRVEKSFSKDQILEMYLNEVGYGGTAYGVQEGARLYFGKDVQDLTLAEAAILAGIPKSPTQYSPFGSHPENAQIRQKEVLHLMQINGYISTQQEDEAKNQDIKYSQNKVDIKAPHFVMYVRDLLEKKYGVEMVTQGGLDVITSLDYDIQKLTEQAVSTEVEKLGKLNVTNGAAVVLNPQTGEILAMVGSKDYFDTNNDGNVNVATSLRQPGSSIKIVNYAYALEHGYTPASILDDTPVSFIIPNQTPYIPKNYEGGYRGKISLRSALAESRNIPAVKVLNSYGVKNMIDLGQKMGITTWTNPQNYGLSLTLGGGDVRLLDLAYVYATIANYGRKPEEISIIKVTNSDRIILEEFDCVEKQIPFTQIANASSSAAAINTADDCPQKQVVSPAVSFLITDILKDNSARAPSFGLNSALVVPKHPEVAVKTGTSNSLRDNLTIGYTQKYVVAVWVGNNNNSPMSRIASGVTGASPIWNKIMSTLLANEQVIEWSIPGGLVQLPICQLTATLACPGCPTKMEWFLEDNRPTYACAKEQIEQIVNAGKKPQILDNAWRSDNSN